MQNSVRRSLEADANVVLLLVPFVSSAGGGDFRYIGLTLTGC